ncbi:MAG TPA: hypothetical protein VEH04_00245 [Verrucomicrobiae bacterium]|nr:hypothetical protein [Verrucomicrobiae bacterium]
MIENISSSKLRRAAAIQEKIESLQSELASLLGSSGQAQASSTSSNTESSGRPKRRLSPEGRARIAAAQRRRWAKAKQKSQGN